MSAVNGADDDDKRDRRISPNPSSGLLPPDEATHIGVPIISVVMQSLAVLNDTTEQSSQVATDNASIQGLPPSISSILSGAQSTSAPLTPLGNGSAPLDAAEQTPLSHTSEQQQQQTTTTAPKTASQNALPTDESKDSLKVSVNNVRVPATIVHSGNDSLEVPSSATPVSPQSPSKPLLRSASINSPGGPGLKPAASTSGLPDKTLQSSASKLNPGVSMRKRSLSANSGAAIQALMRSSSKISSTGSQNSYLTATLKKNPSTTPVTKGKNMSLGAALMMPPPPRVNENMDWKTLTRYAFNAIGVVYSDLASAPLFVIRPAVKNTMPDLQKAISAGTLSSLVIDRTYYEVGVYGAVSFIIWLFIVLSVKYMLLVFQADNNGEGGMLSMMSLIPTPEEDESSPYLRYTYKITLFIGVLGCAFLLGDGMIAPSISLLGAMEGLVAIQGTYHYFSVDPQIFIRYVAGAVLFVVFYVQQYGLGKWSASFKPIMLLWFVVIGVVGLINIIQVPAILQAFNPLCMWNLVYDRGWTQASQTVAVAVIIIAGMEFIYADIGAFKRKPIYLAYGAVVFPSLLFSYLGQGAKLLSLDMSPAHVETSLKIIDDIFFECAPSWLLWPLVILGATVSCLGSQAIISSCYSIIDQAISLRVFPPLETCRVDQGGDHTTAYVPMFNKFLFLGSMIMTLVLGDSENLSQLYGVSVTGAMFITSILLMYIMRYKWRSKTWKLVGYSVVLLFDVALFLSSLTRVIIWSWISLLLSGALFLVMFVYSDTYQERDIAVGDKLWPVNTARQHLRQHPRVKGLGVFVAESDEEVPWVMSLIAQRLPAMPEEVIMLTVQCIKGCPFIAEEDKYIIRNVDPASGLYRLLISHGFAERTVDVRDAIAHAKKKGMKLKQEDNTTYYISRQSVVPDTTKGLWHRFKIRLFEAMARNTSNQAKIYNFPAQDVMEIACTLTL
ncbi:hypothetical protein RI367_004017 [Sorochytrium milnesiophthora]